ncbi:MAG: tetratricopeptide repeat protein [Fimbriimonadaceae bacterium]
MFRRLLAIVSLALTVGQASAAGILIVQLKQVGQTPFDPEGNLLMMLSSNLFDDGRVIPTAWSMSDPLFRVARQEGLVARSDNPNEEDAKAAGVKLHCDYVMTITLWRKATTVFAKAKLFKTGKQIWNDPVIDSRVNQIQSNSAKAAGDTTLTQDELTARMITIQGIGQDASFDTMRSIAQTWSDLLYAGPLKALPPKPRAPDATSIIKSDIKPPVEPPVATKVDNSELMTKVMQFMGKGDKSSAITLLRDAVDIAPLDLERRRALINVLLSAGYYQEAAGQARRAATILPDVVPLSLLAVRAWLAAGFLEQAEVDLKEAVSREPNGAETRALLGEVSLRRGQYADAIPHFDKAIELSPTAELHFKRALALALNGDGGKAKADLDQALKIGFGEDEIAIRSLYLSSIGLLDGAALKGSETIKDLIQRARRNSLDKSLEEDIDQVRMRLESLQKFLGELPTPTEHTTSHGERALGIKLLIQATTELESFVKDREEDAVDDANITLGEALRKLSAGRERYQNESSGKLAR